MAGENDTRVVQMQFDNRKFDRNIARSQKSLERFKRELNFDDASKGIERFSKAATDSIDFTQFSRNIQLLTDKFTGLGTVSEYVASKIRHVWEGAADSILRSVRSITTAQLSPGFAKYESLNKAVQSLRNSTGQTADAIYSILEELNHYTDETSYSFSQGVTAISQMVSSGAADLQTAEKTIEGFYNMAAKAGADANAASHVLQFSLSQAMTLGYMSRNDWKTFETQKMATVEFKEACLEAAVAVGTLTKRGDKYVTKSGKAVDATSKWNQGLQYQWLTTEVLNKVLYRYADTTEEFGAVAYAAAQRCTTFTDAMDAWKDLVSTGFMTAYRLVFGDLTDAMELFSSVCNKVSEGLSTMLDGLNKVLENWSLGGKDSLWAAIFGEMETPDGDVLYEGAYGVLDILRDIGKLISDGFWEMYRMFLPEDVYNSTLETWSDNAEYRLWYLSEDLKDFTDRFREGIEHIRDFFNEKPEGSVKTRWEMVRDVVRSVFNTIGFVAHIIGNIAGFFRRILGQLSPSFDAIFGLFSRLTSKISDTEQSAVRGGKITAFFERLSEKLKPVTDIINRVVIAITRIISAIFSSEDAANGATSTWGKIKGVLKNIWTVVKKIFGPVVEFLATAIEAIADLFTGGFSEENVAAFKQKISTAFGTMLTAIKEGIGPIWEQVKTAIGGLWGTVSEAVSGYFANENTIGYKILEWFKKIFGNVKGWLDRKFPGLSDSIGNFFSGIWEKVTGWLGSDNKWASVKELLKKITDTISGFFEGGLKESFNKVKEAIRGFFTKLFGKKTLEEQMDKVSEETSSISFLDRIKKAFTRPGTFGEAISTGVTVVLDFFKNLDGRIPVLIVAIIGAIYILRKAIKAVQTFADGFKKLANLLSGNFTVTAKVKTETIGERFLKIAGAIAILVASAYVLANLKVWQAVQGIVGVLALMTAMKFMVKYMLKDIAGAKIRDVLKLVFVFVGLAAGIWLLVRALLPLANVEWAGLGAIGAGLVAFMSAFALLVVLLGRNKGSSGAAPNAKAANTKLLQFASVVASIAILLYALKSVTSVDNPWDFVKMGGALVAVMVAMYALTKSVTKLEGKGGMKDSGMIHLAALAAGIAAIIIALKTVADLEWPQLGKMGVAWAALVAGIAGLITVVNLTSKNKQERGLKRSGLMALAGVALGLVGVILALKSVANMEWGQLAKMGVVWGVLISSIAGLIMVINLTSKNQNERGLKDTGLFLSLIGICIGMTVLLSVLRPLADMEWGGISKMLITFMVVFGGIIAAVAVIQRSSRGMKSTITSIMMIAAIVAAMKICIDILVSLNSMEGGMSGKVIRGFWSFVKILTSAVVKISKNTPSLQGAVASIGLIAAIVASMYFLVEIFKPLAGMSWEGVLKVAAGFAVFIKIFESVTKSFSEMTAESSGEVSKILGTIVLMGSVLGSLWALIQILTPLAGMSWGGLAKMAAGLIVFTAVIDIVTKSLLKMSGKNGDTEWSDILKTLAVIAAVCLSVVVLSTTLSKIKDVKASTILAFSIGLSVLMLSMAGAAKVLSNANVKGVIIGIIAIIAGLAGVMAVIGLLGGWMFDSLATSLPAFGESLKTLGESVESFSKSTSGINSADIGTALDLIHGIAKVQFALTAENISVAFFSKLLGADIDKGDLKAFGEDLAAIGGFVGDFAEAISGKDFTNVPTAVSALQSIASVQSSLTNDEIKLALFNKILGLEGEDRINTVSLTSFAEDIREAAPLLAEIGDILAATNFSGFADASEAIKQLSDVRTTLDNEEIKLAIFNKLLGLEGYEKLQQASLADFAADILEAAPKLQQIGEIFKASDFSAFSQAADAIHVLSGVRSTLNNEEIKLAIFNKLLGLEGYEKLEQASLASFADDILDAAPKLQKIGEIFKASDFSSFAQASEAIKQLSEAQSTLNNEQIKLAIFNAIFGLKGEDRIDAVSLGHFLDDIRKAAPKLKEIGTILSGSDFSSFKTASEAIMDLSDAKKEIGNNEIRLALFNKILGLQGDERLKTASLEDFAADIRAAAPMLEEVGEILKGHDFSGFATAGEALKAFADVQRVLTDSEIQKALANVVLDIFGGKEVTDKDLTAFGEDLVPLGEAMAKFAQSVSYIETQEGKIEPLGTEGFNSAIEAIKVLGELQSILSANNGIFDFITGHNYSEISDFSKGLGKLGEGIRNIYSAIFDVGEDGSAVDPKNVETMRDILESLEYLFSTIGISGNAIESNSLTGLRESISDLLTVCTPENAGDIDRMASFMSAMGSAAEELRHYQGMNENIIDAFIYSLLDSKLQQKLKTEEQRLSENGVWIVTALSAGVSADKSVQILNDAIRNLFSSAESTLKMEISNFSASDTMSSFAASLSSSLSEQIGSNPTITITAVLDMSQFESDKAKMDGLFNSYGAPSIRGVNFTSPVTPNSGVNQTPKDYSTYMNSIKSEMADLRGDVRQLNRSIASMRVVMNTGALVGAIGPQMDEYLGREGYYASRSNV